MNQWRVEPRKKKSAKRLAAPRLAVIGLGIVLPFWGCLSLNQMAPPVGPDFLMVAARRGMEATTLELGRQVYLSTCVKCHSVEPIGRYSARRWRKILPRMAGESKLDDQRRAAVEAYVMLARALLDENAETESEIAGSRDSTSGESVVDTYSTHEGG